MNIASKLEKRQRLTYVFRCPVCAKRERFDEPGEPCCTGPSATLDEHELTVMHLFGIEQEEIDPAAAAVRAAGRLIMPHETAVIVRDVRMLLPGNR